MTVEHLIDLPDGKYSGHLAGSKISAQVTAEKLVIGQVNGWYGQPCEFEVRDGVVRSIDLVASDEVEQELVRHEYKPVKKRKIVDH